MVFTSVLVPSMVSPTRRTETFASTRRLPFSISQSEIAASSSTCLRVRRYVRASWGDRKSGPVTISMRGAPQPHGRADRELQRVLVGHRERPRQTEAHGTDSGVGRGPEGGRAAAEHLRDRSQLDVGLEADDRLPGARHYASSAAGTARS